MSTTKDNGAGTLDPMSLEAIEAELAKFEAEERKRLGLPTESTKQWFDAVPRTSVGKFDKKALRARFG